VSFEEVGAIAAATAAAAVIPAGSPLSTSSGAAAADSDKVVVCLGRIVGRGQKLDIRGCSVLCS
jgi:hypothetical protein